ncbi:MAG: DNA methyltransferase, partial [Nitrosopumilaceae archaeon]
ALFSPPYILGRGDYYKTGDNADDIEKKPFKRAVLDFDLVCKYLYLDLQSGSYAVVIVGEAEEGSHRNLGAWKELFAKAGFNPDIRQIRLREIKDYEHVILIARKGEAPEQDKISKIPVNKEGIWDVTRDFRQRPFYGHPCPLAPVVAETLIEIFSEKGEVVLCPFGGIWTVMKAALKVGRHSISCDVKDYKKEHEIKQTEEENQAIHEIGLSPMQLLIFDRKEIPYEIVRVEREKTEIIVGINEEIDKELLTIRPNEVANFIRCLLIFSTLLDTQEILYYQAGVFVQYGEQLIKSMTEYIMGGKCSIDFRNEVVNHVRTQTYTARESFDNDAEIVNCENGLLQLGTKQFIPHKWLRRFNMYYPSRVQLPRIYDPNA